MCDYSLHGVKNRLAVEGESLVVHKFHTGSKGLASEADFEAARPGVLKRIADFLLRPGEKPRRRLPAVCVPPGAKLRLEGIPKALREKYGVGEAEEVTFTQITNEPFRYRDAFRFGNGAEVIIQRFAEGVRVEVLQLALVEEAAEAEEPAPVPTNPIERGMSANA